MNAVTMTEKLHDCRDAFVAVLERLGAENSRVVAVCNDSVGSSKLGGFKSKWPERLVNVGIAEQNMVGVGAGLANGGLLPFVCGASCFLTGRSLEQVKADIAYSNANVKLVGISSGMAYGELGPTHHSIEDFAWMRVLPNLPVIAPCDSIETAAAVEWAARYEGPVFLRLSRVGVPDLLQPGHVFEPGKANRLRDGDAVTLIANGTLTHRAMKAAAILSARGIEARVLNMATVRPIDVDSIVAAARDTGAILTAEEHSVYGGLGSAVAEVVVAEAPVPMKILGVPGIFAPTGSAEFLLDEFGMAPEAMAKPQRNCWPARRPQLTAAEPIRMSLLVWSGIAQHSEPTCPPPFSRSIREPRIRRPCSSRPMARSSPAARRPSASHTRSPAGWSRIPSVSGSPCWRP